MNMFFLVAPDRAEEAQRIVQEQHGPSCGLQLTSRTKLPLVAASTSQGSLRRALNCSRVHTGAALPRCVPCWAAPAHNTWHTDPTPLD